MRESLTKRHSIDASPSCPPTYHTRRMAFVCPRDKPSPQVYSSPTRSTDWEQSAATYICHLHLGWTYLADCGFDLEASVGHAQWLIRTVLEKLERQEKGDNDA